MGDPEFFFPDEFPYDFAPLGSPNLLEVDDSDDDDDKIDDTGCSPQSTLCSETDWERSGTEQHNRPLHLSKVKEKLDYFSPFWVNLDILVGVFPNSKSGSFFVISVDVKLQQLKEQQHQRWRRNSTRQPRAVEYGRRTQFLPSASSSSSSSSTAPALQNKWMRESSTGTGVFLPRASAVASTEASSSATRKKPACSTVLVPARVVQALNLNVQEIGARPTFPGGGFILDIEAMKARTRTMQSQQKKKSNPNYHHLR